MRTPNAATPNDLPAAYAAAVARKDVDAFVALYAEDAVVFDAWERWDYRGRDAWRAMVAAWFGSLQDETLLVTFDDVRVTSSGQSACLHAFVTYTARSAAGAPLRAMTNRLTWFASRIAQAWVVTHEHTSAPAAFETGKVILARGA